MGLFDSAEEQKRKANLKKLEDKRVAFARELAKQGFAPDAMLFAQTNNGGFTALCRFQGQYWLIVSPGFGTDEEFVLERHDRLNWRVEEVKVASEGMGGIFGFGKKAEIGVEYVITLPGGDEVTMPFVGGRNGWMERELRKNPLLSTKRRKGDANLCWDMTPLDSAGAYKVREVTKKYFGE